MPAVAVQNEKHLFWLLAVVLYDNVCLQLKAQGSSVHKLGTSQNSSAK